MDRYIALFDLDGVILDSEGDYSRFWDATGEEYLGVKDFGITIKGHTLVKILNDNFSSAEEREAVECRIEAFEREMPFNYIPGALEFVTSLKQRAIRTAIVTSSDKTKMENVYRRHPEILSLFDRILTSEDFSESKPSPDCYIRGMAALGADPEHTIVFEDSLSGLQSGRASGAVVVALATTSPEDVVAPYGDFVIRDFIGHEIGDFIKE